MFKKLFEIAKERYHNPKDNGDKVWLDGYMAALEDAQYVLDVQNNRKEEE
jgi:hypothetical protein